MRAGWGGQTFGRRWGKGPRKAKVEGVVRKRDEREL